MNTDVLNILMMIASLILAVFLPVELLILSYAFLGPLHYLTEINWLEDKSFFIKGKRWAWILVGLTLCLIIPPTIRELIVNGYLGEETLKNVMKFLGDNYELFLFFGLMLSLILVLLKNNLIILGVFIVVIITSFLVYDSSQPTYDLLNSEDGGWLYDSKGKIMYDRNNFFILFGVFLPTIIHVYLFTGLFMLYGSLKSKSNIGTVSVVLLFLIPVFIFNMDLVPESYEVSKYGFQALVDSNFYSLNQSLVEFFGGFNLFTDFNQENSLTIPKELEVGSQKHIHLKAQVFIAFAYIYHYLNWFSKTTVIKWHKSFSKRRVITIVGTYIAAIGLYLYNYKVGFIAMFFLSFLHVLLEFPLNVVSIKGIGQEIGKRITGGGSK